MKASMIEWDLDRHALPSDSGHILLGLFQYRGVEILYNCESAFYPSALALCLNWMPRSLKKANWREER